MSDTLYTCQIIDHYIKNGKIFKEEYDPFSFNIKADSTLMKTRLDRLCFTQPVPRLSGKTSIITCKTNVIFRDKSGKFVSYKKLMLEPALSVDFPNFVKNVPNFPEKPVLH